MSKFKIAVAQVPSLKGDVRSNIDTHIRVMAKAGSLAVSYLVFPELSLTGYEPEMASSLAFSSDDDRIKPLISAAQEHQVQVVVGAPLATDNLPHIGAFLIAPTGDVLTYSKMHLHPGEERFFSVGRGYQVIQIGDEKVANAICADANCPEHAKACSERGATIYAAGALITASGYAADTEKMQSYAGKYEILVAMANHNTPTGGWSPTGKSAIWSPFGLLAAADEVQSALVIAQREPTGWLGEVIDISWKESMNNGN